MKANELRLGNLIKVGGNTLDTYQTFIPTLVTLAILNEIAGENEERPDAELSVFMPIQLTEEWLLKFGFKEDGTRPDWCDLLSSYNIGNDKIQYLRNESWKCLKIRYVHQLQNLYFALTGQELTIK